MFFFFPRPYGYRHGYYGRDRCSRYSGAERAECEGHYNQCEEVDGQIRCTATAGSGGLTRDDLMVTGFNARTASYPLSITINRVAVKFAPGSTEPMEWLQPLSIGLSEVDFDEEDGLTVVALIFIIIACLCCIGICVCICCKTGMCDDDKSGSNSNYSQPNYSEPYNNGYNNGQSQMAMNQFPPPVPGYPANDPQAKYDVDHGNGSYGNGASVHSNGNGSAAEVGYPWPQHSLWTSVRPRMPTRTSKIHISNRCNLGLPSDGGCQLVHHPRSTWSGLNQ